MDVIFHEIYRNYIVKNFFKGFIKLDKIVEISCILGIIDDLENNLLNIHIKSGTFRLQKTIPESQLNLLSENEWMRRIEVF